MLGILRSQSLTLESSKGKMETGQDAGVGQGRETGQGLARRVVLKAPALGSGESPQNLPGLPTWT